MQCGIKFAEAMARKICAGKEHTRKFNVIAIGESGLGKKRYYTKFFVLTAPT